MQRSPHHPTTPAGGSTAGGQGGARVSRRRPLRCCIPRRSATARSARGHAGLYSGGVGRRVRNTRRSPEPLRDAAKRRVLAPADRSESRFERPAAVHCGPAATPAPGARPSARVPDDLGDTFTEVRTRRPRPRRPAAVPCRPRTAPRRPRSATLCTDRPPPYRARPSRPPPCGTPSATSRGTGRPTCSSKRRRWRRRSATRAASPPRGGSRGGNVPIARRRRSGTRAKKNVVMT